MSKIRTRFAPSTTGRMHVGNLRTALYAYLKRLDFSMMRDLTRMADAVHMCRVSVWHRVST